MGLRVEDEVDKVVAEIAKFGRMRPKALKGV